MCVRTRACVCMSAVPTEVSSVRSPGAGVIGGCEPLDVGAGNELGSSGRTVQSLIPDPSLQSPLYFLSQSLLLGPGYHPASPRDPPVPAHLA